MGVYELINYLVNSIKDGNADINDEVLLCCKNSNNKGYDNYSKVIHVVCINGKCSILGTEPKTWDELFPDLF